MKFRNLWFVPLLGTLMYCSPPKIETPATEGEQRVTVKEMVQKGAFLVDVRTPEEFASGTVKGAVNIPIDEVESRVKEFERKPSVIVFCRTGRRSGQAKNILEAHGIPNVINGINVSAMENELK